MLKRDIVAIYRNQNISKTTIYRLIRECEEGLPCTSMNLPKTGPNFSYPFTLQCDASDVGIGAVLTQNIEGKEQVICYPSRALLPAEQRYSTTEKECLSVIYAIERLRCYLEGTRFTVVTDHYSLLWLNNLKDPLGRVGRGVMRLQAFDFDIVHRKGKDNVVPDCLSRAVVPVQAQLDQLVIRVREISGLTT
jgi:hypothetical protein